MARDLSDSAYDFQRVVWPAIRHVVGGGMIEPVESVAGRSFAWQLDACAGIDVWHVQEGKIRALGSRVQWVPRSWDSFTIRKARLSGASTEYEKRTEAIYGAEGWLYPHLTVQAYVSARRTGRLLAAGVIRTHDLYDHLRRGGRHSTRRSHADGTTFIIVYWKDLGDRVTVVRPTDGAAA